MKDVCISVQCTVLALRTNSCPEQYESDMYYEYTAAVDRWLLLLAEVSRLG